MERDNKGRFTSKGMLRNSYGFKKGNHPDTEFKKGQNIGEEHFKWKGDNVSYDGLHKWIKNNFGEPIRCNFCEDTTNIQRASIWHTYTRNKEDWIQLCPTCHKGFDSNIINKDFQLNIMEVKR